MAADALEVHVPDPADVLAVLRPVVQAGDEEEAARGSCGQEVQDLVAAGGVLDENHPQAVPPISNFSIRPKPQANSERDLEINAASSSMACPAAMQAQAL